MPILTPKNFPRFEKHHRCRGAFFSAARSLTAADSNLPPCQHFRSFISFTTLITPRGPLTFLLRETSGEKCDAENTNFPPLVLQAGVPRLTSLFVIQFFFFPFCEFFQ